ncbi:MAG: DNA polymerase III subunit delta [Fuerstiella sp.]|nr:DNA polymerase III subunit delta [Fuerstiella sp.]
MMHATEFLSKNATIPDVPVLVMYGTERYLKLQTLNLIPGLEDDTEDVALTRTAGKDADLKSVCDELLTVSMFGDKRIVMIDDADDFVSQHRAGLEKYVANPSKTSLLILDVKSWPKNTKLAKATEKIGLNLECGELKGAALVKWLIRTATEVHQKQLDRDAANLIVQLAGDSLGLLQQELDKLAALVGDEETITPEDVTRVVGGWGEKKT